MSSRSFVFADPNRCIGCKTCMVACIRSHTGSEVTGPRLQLVTTRKVSAPISCHHCIDAPCVKCIGCQNCVLACPFGAIAIGSKPKVELFGGISFGAGQEPVVVKCDLCVGRNGGPACVEACPTEGLYLADGAFLSSEAALKHSKAAKTAESFMESFSNATV